MCCPQDEAALLDALTVLLDGNMTPASTTSALMSPTQQPMEHSYGLHRAVDHAPALPIPTPTAAQLPPHTSQVSPAVLCNWFRMVCCGHRLSCCLAHTCHTPARAPLGATALILCCTRPAAVLQLACGWFTADTQLSVEVWSAGTSVCAGAVTCTVPQSSSEQHGQEGSHPPAHSSRLS